MKSEKVKEIKKAINCCISGNDCTENCCTYYKNKKSFKCMDDLLKDILTYINELEETNERLLEGNYQKEQDFRKAEKRIAELEKENDDYKHRCEIIKGLIDSKRIVEFDVTAPLPPIHNIIY